MEWIHGVSLAYLLKTLPNRRMDYGIAAQLLAQAAAGLHAAHELKDDEGQLLEVVHRDATPQNLLIAATGDLKVVDFGIVKAKNQIHQATETGELKGKLSYLSPEQVRGKTLDRRADVFSLGCVLYVATTGRSPFNDGDAASTITKLMNGEYPPRRRWSRTIRISSSGSWCGRWRVSRRIATPAPTRSGSHWKTSLRPRPRPTTRDDVARLVNERCGTSVEACRASIRAAQRCSIRRRPRCACSTPAAARTGRSGTCRGPRCASLRVAAETGARAPALAEHHPTPAVDPRGSSTYRAVVGYEDRIRLGPDVDRAIVTRRPARRNPGDFAAQRWRSGSGMTALLRPAWSASRARRRTRERPSPPLR